VVDRAGGIYTFDTATGDWVVESLYVPSRVVPLQWLDVVFPLSASQDIAHLPIGTDDDFYLVDLEFCLEVGGTNGAPNDWQLDLRTQAGDLVCQFITEDDDPDTTLRYRFTTGDLNISRFNVGVTNYLRFMLGKNSSPGDIVHLEIVARVLDVFSPA
jgi:hypothetical protein